MTPDLADQRLREASASRDFVLVPGRYNSGPEHWQSYWERDLPIWRRIAQRDWDDPYVMRWVASIGRVLGSCPHRAFLAGHSLGALAACRAAVEAPQRIAGLLLVAPAEPGRFDAEEDVPDTTLPVPSLVVASRNDPFMSFARAEHWAARWGSELVDLGADAGHVNAESGFGPWRYGRVLLAGLVARDGELANRKEAPPGAD